jgi:hypothetical protein
VKKSLTLQEQRQKRNDKHQKDGHDTPPNPIKDRNEMVASLLANDHIAPRVHFTNSQLFVQCTDIEHCKMKINPSTLRKEKKGNSQVTMKT